MKNSGRTWRWAIGCFVATVGVLATSQTASLFNATSGNALGIDLAREASQAESEPKNMMISPVSFHMALSMVLNGASGITKQDLIARMSGSPVNASVAQQINEANSQLIKKLYAKKSIIPTNRGPALTISNSVWRTNGQTDHRRFAFKPEFLKTIKDSYAGEVQALDFRKPASVDVINSWVSRKTFNLIPKIMDAETLNPMLWVILNATYFEGKWNTPFNLQTSNPPAFHLLNGDLANVEMIGRQDHHHYLKTDQGEWVAVPFAMERENDPEVSFYIFLPASAEDYSVIQKSVWSREFWDSGVKSLNEAGPSYGTLIMPKFSFDYRVTLLAGKPLTMALGLDFLFSGQADFSAMATPDSLASAVGIIKQQTRIKLDEKGVTAAAATMVGGRETSAPDQPVYSMVVDRPFFFAIIEEKTSTILFAGSVIDPREVP